jgi:hypothetical protein
MLAIAADRRGLVCSVTDSGHDVLQMTGKEKPRERGLIVRKDSAQSPVRGALRATLEGARIRLGATLERGARVGISGVRILARDPFGMRVAPLRRKLGRAVCTLESLRPRTVARFRVDLRGRSRYGFAGFDSQV